MRMQDFKPISLCNVIYKIISKTLANRLKKILDDIISPTQSAFVLGRLITDDAILGFECIHSLQSQTTGKVGVVALKIDMSKAYDRVEWSYLRRVMKMMDFCSCWIELTMSCVETVDFSVLTNGFPGPSFKPNIGLRQGDPLSPYLFLLCLEGFSALLARE